MDDRINRGKLVSFCVSEEEFSQNREAAQASGSRSVSMFACDAVLSPQKGAATTGNSDIEDHLVHIDQKVEAVITILVPLTNAAKIVTR